MWCGELSKGKIFLCKYEFDLCRGNCETHPCYENCFNIYDKCLDEVLENHIKCKNDFLTNNKKEAKMVSWDLYCILGLIFIIVTSYFIARS